MSRQADPFDTAGVAERVLAGWAAAPERFREDANAEEDLAHGGYRDRVVVELAQNAADAAARAGVAGRLLLRLVDAGDAADGPPVEGGHAGVLVAANTGAGLDAAGVRALATLRASAKRPGEQLQEGEQPQTIVGRFGVGFSAVLAVTDAPSVLSRSGGVRFSRADTRVLVEEAGADHPALRVELERREGHVPVLRLPFPAEGTPPDGYDSAVLLPLRDGSARDLVVHLLEQLDDGLLLALPHLAEVVVELPDGPPRVLAGARERWWTLSRAGTHPPSALANRPTEERQRPGWSLTWAVARQEQQSPPARVVHAPTPTDEPLDWDALLVASFPLDPTRRHVTPGAATDAVVREAATGYAELLARLAADGTDVLPLVPTGLPGGRLDAELREATLPRLRTAPVLLAVEDGGALRPGDAVALDPGPWAGDHTVLAALAPVVAGLVAAPRRYEAALAVLGVRRLGLAELVDLLPQPPAPDGWVRLYGALAPLADDPAAREALGALPVPLLDGRVVRGARACVLPPTGVADDVLDLLGRLGTRLVDPEVAGDDRASRLLQRLGAQAARPLDLLDSPQVRHAVAVAADEHDDGSGDWDADELAGALLPLVAAALEDSWPAGGLPWLAGLPLPDADGEPAPAGELVQPGSTAAGLLDDDATGTLAPDLFARWPSALWRAVGVADSLHALTWSDVDTADLPEELADLDGAEEWAHRLGQGTVVQVTAVRDLDLVLPRRWPDGLRLLAGDPALRRAVLDPVTVQAPDGRSRRLPGYTAWWLRRELGLAGAATDDADPPLPDLLPAAPSWAADLDPQVAGVLGLVRTWADLDAGGWQDVLHAAAGGPPPPLPALLAMWSALATAAAGLVHPDSGPHADSAPELDPVPPGRTWALRGDDVALVDLADVVVVDAPMWRQRQDLGAQLVVPPALAEPLADVLDVDLASERAAGAVDGGGSDAVAVPAAVLALLPGAPATWREHDDLTVDGVAVDWWVQGAGPTAVVHACTIGGLARGLAQAGGAWSTRLAVEAVLADEGSSAATLVEEWSG